MKSVLIRGKRFKVKNSDDWKGPELGYCTCPHIGEREIMIPVNGDTLDELCVICHEVVHACDWDLSEEAVEEISIALGTVIWKLKWRKEF